MEVFSIGLSEKVFATVFRDFFMPLKPVLEVFLARILTDTFAEVSLDIFSNGKFPCKITREYLSYSILRLPLSFKVGHGSVY